MKYAEACCDAFGEAEDFEHIKGERLEKSKVHEITRRRDPKY
jgi:hypothetical protein